MYFLFFDLDMFVVELLFGFYFLIGWAEEQETLSAEIKPCSMANQQAMELLEAIIHFHKLCVSKKLLTRILCLAQKSRLTRFLLSIHTDP